MGGKADTQEKLVIKKKDLANSEDTKLVILSN
jgi:hypothetical protein